MGARYAAAGIDSDQDVLAIQDPANAGTLTTVGALGPRVTDVLGFDIGERNRAFAALQRENRRHSRLFRVNLRSGRATAVTTATATATAIATEPRARRRLGLSPGRRP